MNGFGALVLIVGICWLVFALGMDVSVSTGAGGKVNNLRLMTNRQVHAIIGGMITLAGLLMVLLGGKNTNVLASAEVEAVAAHLQKFG
jgi:hypothetical protein